MGYDIFISYSRADNTQCRITELVEQIKKDFSIFAGRPLAPFFDLKEINGMEDWRHRILQGLRESRLLLACLSPAFLKSEYCEWEFNEYIKNEIGHSCFGDGIAPIYFVEVPGWNDKNFENNCREWVSELRRRQHFDLRPWFFEGEESLREAAVHERMKKLNFQIKERIKRGELAEKSLGNVDAHNPRFIGRITELRRMRETVALGKVGILTAVHGLGGVGKTALAIEYAHAYAHEYGGGRWQVRCEGKEDLCAAIAELSSPLKIMFSDDEKKDINRQFQRVISELRRLADENEPHKCLLILDNVDKPKLIEPAKTQMLPAAEWLHVIITTRLGENELFGKQKDRAFLPVDELPENDAIELIQTYQPGGNFADEAEREAAKEIVNLLGRFTLAVESAAVYLGAFSDDISCAGFLARLKKEGITGLDSAAENMSEGLRHGEKCLAATLYPTIEQLSEPEKLVLSYAALLLADNIVLPWLKSLAAKEFPELEKDDEPGYPNPWKNLLRRLFSLRLIQLTNAMDDKGQPLVVRMHRIIGELLRKQNTDESNSGRIENIISYALSRSEFMEENWHIPNEQWEIEPLAVFAEQLLESKHTKAPEFVMSIGGWFCEIFPLPRAENVYRQALQLLGDGEDEDLVRANLLSNLGNVLQSLAKFEEAETVKRRALEINEKSFGKEHPSVATSLNNLAQLLKDTNRLSEAKPMMRRALEIDEKSFGKEHPRVASKLNNLALLLKDTNRFSEAETMMRRALEINEKSLGKEHHNVARGLNNLAHLLRDTTRLSEAEPLYRRALKINEKILPKDHPDVATTLNNLAEILRATNRLSEAKPMMIRALEIFEKSLGKEHPNVATALSGLANLLQDTNQLEEAELIYRRALEIDEKSFGKEHPNVARDLNNLAELLRITNRLSEAEPLYRRALEINEKSFGKEHPAIAISLNNLAGLLKATNRFSEAEPLHRRALEIKEKSFGKEHPDVANSLNNLSGLLHTTNRLSEAELMMRRALEILLKFKKDSKHLHAHFEETLKNYSILLYNLGKSKKEILRNITDLGRTYGIKPKEMEGYLGIESSDKINQNITNIFRTPSKNEDIIGKLINEDNAIPTELKNLFKNKK